MEGPTNDVTQHGETDTRLPALRAFLGAAQCRRAGRLPPVQ